MMNPDVRADVKLLTAGPAKDTEADAVVDDEATELNEDAADEDDDDDDEDVEDADEDGPAAGDEPPSR